MSRGASPPAATIARDVGDHRGARLALLLLVIGYAAFQSVGCWIKYNAFLYDDIDLAIFTQALANLMHGSLASSIRGGSWLGDHSSLNLILIAPFYAVFRTPVTLLVLQSVALALGALPVYRLARRELNDAWAALGCAALYLLYPALGYLNAFEFHPESLSTPMSLAAIAMLREGRTRSTAIWAGLALLGKEDVALVVAALGVYALARRRRESGRQAAWLIGLAAAALALTFGVLKPMLAGGGADYGAMYARWGRTPFEALGAIVRAPLSAIGAMFGTPGNAHDTLLKQQYWIHLLLPLAFLPLAAPELLLIALPIVAEHMLSWRTQQHTILYQYTALVIPFTVAAAVVGLGRLAAAAKGGAAARRFAGLALLATFASQAMFGPMATTRFMQAAKPLQRTLPTEYDRTMAAEKRRLIARIPAKGGVVAGLDLLAPLAARSDLHSLHHVLTGRYTFSERAFPTPAGVVALIADWSEDRLVAYPDSGTAGRLRDLVERNRLAPAEAVGDLVLYLREPATRVTLVARGSCGSGARAPIAFDHQLEFLGAGVPESTLVAGDRLRFGTCWRAVAPIDALFLTEWLLLDADGRLVFSRIRHLGFMIAPPSTWAPGEPMVELYDLPLPGSLAPGRYTLAMRVGARRAGRSALAIANDPAVAARDGVIPLGAFTIAAR